MNETKDIQDEETRASETERGENDISRDGEEIGFGFGF